MRDKLSVLWYKTLLGVSFFEVQQWGKCNNARNRFKEYIYNPAVNVKDRAFIIFSFTVLLTLFATVPCGIIMREPLIATISTLIGAILFSLYVIYAIKSKTIEFAKIFISIILVFVFLPAMFFTNGGVEGGTPIWLLLGTVYITLILDGAFQFVMLQFF